MGILAGPLCSYKDYITFIEGRSYRLQQSEANGKEDTKYEQTDPSPNVRCMTLAVLMLMEPLHGKLVLHSSFTGITAELYLEFIHQQNSSLFKKLYAYFLKAGFLLVSSLDLVDESKLIWSFLTSLYGKKPFLI